MMPPRPSCRVAACVVLALFAAAAGRLADGAQADTLCRLQGQVSAADGAPVAGVTVRFSNGLPSQVTDRLGCFEVAATGDGARCTVTPSKAGYSFLPAARSVWLSGGQADASFQALPDRAEKSHRRALLDAFLGDPTITWFAINNGAAFTPNRTVTLNNTCDNGPLYLMASESPSFTGASWELYSATPSFTLSDGNDTKTVYLKVADDFVESEAASDTIVLDVPAAVELIVNGPVERGKVWQAGEQNWFYFTAAADDTYTIETWTGSLADNVVGLYAADQTTLIAEDDDSGEGTCGKIVRALAAGTYFVKVRAKDPAATGTYYIQVTSGATTVTILNPHGDPTASTQLEVGNSEVVFNMSAPGVLEVVCSFVVTPGPVTGVADKVRACIEPVGPATLSWQTLTGTPSVWGGTPSGRPATAHISMGKAVFNATTSRYEVKAVFTGMPANNSDLGPKKLWAQVVDGTTVVASAEQPLEVFFSKDGTNNPGTGINAGPNWFYYWKNGNVCGTTTGWEFESDSGAFGFYMTGEDHINVCDLAPTVNTGPEYYANDLGDYITVAGEGLGFQCCLETIAHEFLHKWIFETWEPLIAAAEADGENDGDDYDDPDDDGIPNIFEPTYLGIVTDPNDPDTYNMGYPYDTYGDQEVRCRKEELDPGLPPHSEADWAYPGANSYPPYPLPRPAAEPPDLVPTGDGDEGDTGGDQGDLDNEGNPGDDTILQDGTHHGDAQTAQGGPGNDTIMQFGSGGPDTQNATGGDDNDTIAQRGGRGADTTTASGGNGNDTINQRGKRGWDALTANGGPGNDVIWQRGGRGHDTLTANGGDGDDVIWMYGGDGDDTLVYDVSSGGDLAYLDGCDGHDSATIKSNGQNFAILDKDGNVLYQRGEGGTQIRARSLETLTVLGDDGVTPIFTGSAP